jgi:hypothetical protein
METFEVGQKVWKMRQDGTGLESGCLIRISPMGQSFQIAWDTPPLGGMSPRTPEKPWATTS